MVSQVEALVFADESEYRVVAGGSAGKFLPGVGATGSLLVVRHTDDLQALETVVAHELAHRFADAVHPGLPNWLDEGIAMYLESVEVRDDKVRFGVAPREPTHGFTVAGGVSFADLVGAKPARLYGPEARFYYSAGWALVHYLLSGREGALRSRFPQLLSAVEDATRRRQGAEVAFAQVYPDVPVAELDRAIARLTGSLNRPGVDLLMVMPFRRAAAERIDRRPSDSRQVAALVEAVQRRNWRAPEPQVDLNARPHFAGADAHAAFELSYLGVHYGYVFRAPFAWEVDVGLGPLGYTAAGLARYHLLVGDGGHFFVSAGFGPVAALKSEWLGNKIEHHQDVLLARRGLYYFLGLHPELSAEIRSPSNVIARLSVGGYFRLAENLSPLCQGPRPTAESGCAPRDGRSGAQIADAGRHLFGRLTMGYSW